MSWGRFWGRGRFSERSASPPDPLSRRAAGVRVGDFCEVGSACELGRSPISLGVVTAADRAAATVQCGERTPPPALGGRREPFGTLPTKPPLKGEVPAAGGRREPFGTLPAKPPLRGEVPAAGGRRGSSPRATKFAAALSAAVTTTAKQGNVPTSHGHASPKKESSLFPATLRERGAGGEALLLEKRPLLQRSPTPSFQEGARGRGLF